MALRVYATDNVRSLDGPQWIRLIGSSAPWLLLAVPASIFLKRYLSKLGELAAEGTSELFVHAWAVFQLSLRTNAYPILHGRA
jgi:hypothetical protein